VLHVIELSWESGAVALLFCILYRRAACRRNFSFRASIILHLTVAAATTTAIATGLALHSNVVSRASRERTAIGLGERENEQKRERETVTRRRTDWLLVYRYGFHFQCHLDSYTNRFPRQNRDTCVLYYNIL